MSRKIGLICVYNLVIVAHHNIFYVSSVHTHSWNTTNKMVWHRRRLQCPRYGAVGAQPGGFVQLQRPKVQPQDGATPGRPVGEWIWCLLFYKTHPTITGLLYGSDVWRSTVLFNTTTQYIALYDNYNPYKYTTMQGVPHITEGSICLQE